MKQPTAPDPSAAMNRWLRAQRTIPTVQSAAPAVSAGANDLNTAIRRAAGRMIEHQEETPDEDQR